MKKVERTPALTILLNYKINGKMAKQIAFKTKQEEGTGLLFEVRKQIHLPKQDKHL
jgi:hypothetical protein